MNGYHIFLQQSQRTQPIILITKPPPFIIRPDRRRFHNQETPKFAANGAKFFAFTTILLYPLGKIVKSTSNLEHRYDHLRQLSLAWLFVLGGRKCLYLDFGMPVNNLGYPGNRFWPSFGRKNAWQSVIFYTGFLKTRSFFGMSRLFSLLGLDCRKTDLHQPPCYVKTQKNLNTGKNRPQKWYFLGICCF